MARMARAVIPRIPHHITLRGVRRMETFFDDEDYEAYRAPRKTSHELNDVDFRS